MPGPKPAGAGVVERTVVEYVVRDGVSLDEAVSRAERQYKARVVRTEVQDEDGRKVYVLKLRRAEGRVFTVRVDAQSGRSRCCASCWSRTKPRCEKVYGNSW